MRQDRPGVTRSVRTDVAVSAARVTRVTGVMDDDNVLVSRRGYIGANKIIGFNTYLQYLCISD